MNKILILGCALISSHLFAFGESETILLGPRGGTPSYAELIIPDGWVETSIDIRSSTIQIKKAVDAPFEGTVTVLNGGQGSPQTMFVCTQNINRLTYNNPYWVVIAESKAPYSGTATLKNLKGAPVGYTQATLRTSHVPYGFIVIPEPAFGSRIPNTHHTIKKIMGEPSAMPEAASAASAASGSQSYAPVYGTQSAPSKWRR